MMIMINSCSFIVSMLHIFTVFVASLCCTIVPFLTSRKQQQKDNFDYYFDPDRTRPVPGIYLLFYVFFIIFVCVSTLCVSVDYDIRLVCVGTSCSLLSFDSRLNSSTCRPSLLFLRCVIPAYINDLCIDVYVSEMACPANWRPAVACEQLALCGNRRTLVER